MSRSPSVVALVALAVVALVGACGGGETSADATTSSAASSASSSTTPTSVATTEDGEDAATSTSTEPVVASEPVAVLVVGDSVGYTLAEYAPDDVALVERVEARALPGCGLLTEGERPPAAVEAGAPPRYDDCGPAIPDADEAGLATDPDVTLLVLGAWERSDHVRDGRVVGPGDPEWTATIVDLLRARVESLSAGGTPVALWIDPCGKDADVRSRQEWFRDEVVAPVVEATADRGTVALDPSDVVCTDGVAAPVDGVGDPRPDDGQHWSPEGAAWLWRTWLGEQLAATAAP